MGVVNFRASGIGKEVQGEIITQRTRRVIDRGGFMCSVESWIQSCVMAAATEGESRLYQ